jgi:hypothetical protein
VQVCGMTGLRAPDNPLMMDLSLVNHLADYPAARRQEKPLNQ